MYIRRTIDKTLLDWKNAAVHKPLLLRGARQVGKTSAIRHLGESFTYYAELNFEERPQLAQGFEGELDVRDIISKIGVLLNIPVRPGDTLLFLDEIQACPKALNALRFFKEKLPDLHVIAAGSLLEFVLDDIPTFAVGRLRSVFIFPLSFDEFLSAINEQGLVEVKNAASPDAPIDEVFHERLKELFRIYLIVGGMPEAVSSWITTGQYSEVAHIQNDIITGYSADFSKYKKRINPDLLRICMISVAHQIGNKFVLNRVSPDHQGKQIKEALRLLILAGLVIPVTRTAANGLPLESGADHSYRKYLFVDTGLLLRILALNMGYANIGAEVLLQEETALVNKGSLTEMAAGLEIIKYSDAYEFTNLYYWVREEQGSSAEVDYLFVKEGVVYPVEIKSETKGGMKSMYYF